MPQRATILTVDDDPRSPRAITRDLRSRYGARLPDRARDLGRRGARRARRARPARPPGRADRLRPADAGDDRHRVPRAGARDLPRRQAAAAHRVRRHRRRDPGDQRHRARLLPAQAVGPARERLYPVLDDLLDDWRQAHPDASTGVRVVGHRWSRAQPRGQDVPRPQPRAVPLARPRARRRGRPAARARRRRRTPTCRSCWCPTASRCARPTTSSSPTRSACAPAPSSRSTTCASSAAVRPGSRPRCTRASEGLRTVVVEREAPGGQAGQSAAIENYLGFPKGLSGADLTHRAVAQASRFGAEMVLARDVVGLEARGPVRAVRFADGGEIEAARCSSRPASPTAGSRRRGLDELAGSRRLLRRDRERGAPSAPTTTCTSSARPTRPARRRSTSPATPGGSCCSCAAPASRSRCRSTSSSGSAAADNVEVRFRTEVVAGARRRPPRGAHPRRPRHRRRGGGADQLAVRLHRRARPAPTGSATPWSATTRASSSPARTCSCPSTPAGGRCARAPFALETSVPGVFAAGDVRLDSMKRVASAVGEGAMSVYLVHRYLATSDGPRRAARAGALRRARRRAARRPARRGRRGAAPAAASCCSTRASRPTSGGCCSRARSTWCGRSAARSRCSGT